MYEGIKEPHNQHYVAKIQRYNNYLQEHYTSKHRKSQCVKPYLLKIQKNKNF